MFRSYLGYHLAARDFAVEKWTINYATFHSSASSGQLPVELCGVVVHVLIALVHRLVFYIHSCNNAVQNFVDVHTYIVIDWTHFLINYYYYFQKL